ncbi:uncharacterized protein LOC141607033 [Silene latifolia]|uniref:uncharacterized protein LOC141607033 n=1 Tax=Silene latifolia TaxID=37657 RepID=UPI003D76CAD8
MGRGGRSSGSRSYSSAPARRSATPKPARSSTSQAQQPNGLAGFGAAILEGFGWRMGWDITERMISSVFGPRKINHQIVGSAPPEAEAYDACAVHSKAFQDCLNSCGSEIGKCQFYMDMVSNCRHNSGSAINA